LFFKLEDVFRTLQGFRKLGAVYKGIGTVRALLELVLASSYVLADLEHCEASKSLPVLALLSWGSFKLTSNIWTRDREISTSAFGDS